jgi:hypothetical protein
MTATEYVLDVLVNPAELWPRNDSAMGRRDDRPIDGEPLSSDRCVRSLSQ